MKTYLFYYLGYCILINCGETSYSKESPNLLIVKVKESPYDHFGRWSWLDAKIVKKQNKKGGKSNSNDKSANKVNGNCEL